MRASRPARCGYIYSVKASRRITLGFCYSYSDAHTLLAMGATLAHIQSCSHMETNAEANGKVQGRTLLACSKRLLRSSSNESLWDYSAKNMQERLEK